MNLEDAKVNHRIIIQTGGDPQEDITVQSPAQSKADFTDGQHGSALFQLGFEFSEDEDNICKFTPNPKEVQTHV